MTDHYSASDLKTAGKLFILKQYLHPYLNIIHDHYEHVVYVDTHAGTGKTTVLDDKITLQGSALLALGEETKGGFDQYVFFEKDPDRIELLANTIEEEYNYPLITDSLPSGAKTYKSDLRDDPEIRMIQVNSNAGVQLLADLSNEHHHWFTFVDPGKLRHLNMDTVDSLVDRGGMDILINYHTSGVKRTASSDHSMGRAEKYTGRKDLKNGAKSLDDYAEDYCERLGSNKTNWEAIHKPMVDPRNPNYRFDMVFAARKQVARKIVKQIWNDEDFWPRVREYMEDQRDDDDPKQSGFGDYT